MYIKAMKYIALFFIFVFISNANTAFADKEKDCREQSKSRLQLYEKPDSYTINDKEKANALIALFSQCMKEQDGKSNDKIDPNYGNENIEKSPNSTVIVGQDGSVRTVNNASNNYHGASVVIVQAQPKVITADELYPNAVNATNAESDAAKANNANKNATNQQPITIVNNIPPQQESEQKDKQSNNKPPAPAPVTVNVTNNIPKAEAEKPQQQATNNNAQQAAQQDKPQTTPSNNGNTYIPNNTYISNTEHQSSLPQSQMAANAPVLPNTIINNSTTSPQPVAAKPPQVSVTVNNSVPNVSNKSEQFISGNNQQLPQQPKSQNLPNVNNTYMDGSEKFDLPASNLTEQLPQNIAHTTATTTANTAANTALPSIIASNPVVNNSFAAPTPPKPAPINVTVNNSNPIKNSLPAATNNISAPSKPSLTNNNTNKPAPISVSDTIPTPVAESPKPTIDLPNNPLPKVKPATIEKSATSTSSSSYREIENIHSKEITETITPDFSPVPAPKITPSVVKPKIKKLPHKKIKKNPPPTQNSKTQLEEILMRDK